MVLKKNIHSKKYFLGNKSSFMKIIRIKTRKKKLPNSDRRKSAEYPANRLDPTSKLNKLSKY